MAFENNLFADLIPAGGANNPPAETATPSAIPGYIHVGGTPKPAEQWRDATPEEVAQTGRDSSQKWQVSAAGEWKPQGKDTAAPSIRKREIAIGLMKTAGLDLEKGTDPVADLIRNSTSGEVEQKGARAYEWATGALGGVGIGPGGQATAGMEKIGALKSIANTLTLELTGGNLGNQISDADRKFFEQQLGDIGNPDIPWNTRLAAWEQVKTRLANLTGITYQAQPTGAGAQPAATAAAAGPAPPLPPGSPGTTPPGILPYTQASVGAEGQVTAGPRRGCRST